MRAACYFSLSVLKVWASNELGHGDNGLLMA